MEANVITGIWFVMVNTFRRASISGIDISAFTCDFPPDITPHLWDVPVSCCIPLYCTISNVSQGNQQLVPIMIKNIHSVLSIKPKRSKINQMPWHSNHYFVRFVHGSSGASCQYCKVHWDMFSIRRVLYL